MWKVILAIALIFNTSFAIKDSVAARSAQPIPVIIKFEVLGAGLCRLHFEDGMQRDISCKK